MLKKIIIIIVVILVVAVGLFIINFRIAGKTEEQVVCTMEALLCPDGSYVGKSGPKCEFKACPSQASIEGTLRQDANGFQLITAAPDNGTTETAYVLPLMFNATNTASQMVGKKVIVFGKYITGNILNVESLEESKVSDPTLGQVGVGQTVYINRVKITLNKIVNDSRCPVNFQCIRAGDITAEVTLQSDTDKETKNIVSGKTAVPFDSFMISIVGVNPPRTSTADPKSENYLLTFKVTSNI